MGRVLVIDDEQMIRDMLQFALKRLNFTVETADNASGGIEKFDSGAYDLVITDVRMPGVDGYKVVNHIRSTRQGKTPVIGVSGTPWLLQNGNFDEVLHKPFSLHALMEKVTALTAANRLEAQAELAV